MLRPRVSAIALILVALLGASGCGGDDDGDKPTGALTPAELKSASLTKSDLPDGYELEEQVNSTSPGNCGDEGFPPSFLATLKELGFRGCAGATYRKVVTEPNRQVNRPGSLLIALRSEDAAAEALPKLRAALVDSIKLSGSAELGDQNDIAVSGLGDEAPEGLKIPVDLGIVGGKTELYVYFWRRGDVIAFMGTSNFLGDFDEGSALDLAKQIDDRVAG